jgi:hypothetical protein
VLCCDRIPTFHRYTLSTSSGWSDWLSVGFKVTFRQTIGRSVSQSVLASCNLRGLWPDFSLWSDHYVFIRHGVSSLKRRRVCLISRQIPCEILYTDVQSSLFEIVYIYAHMRARAHARKHTQGLRQPRLYNTLCPILISAQSYNNLDSWTVVCPISTKFELFIFPVLSFALACVANRYISTILYDLWNDCILPQHYTVSQL